jgi:hydrogenase expression/formation protein HypC
MCLGIPGEVVAVREDGGLRFATVRFGAITRDVCLECQPDATVGDWVLVHVGLAIARIDREQAASALEVLRAIGATDELDADRAAGGGAP